MNTTYSTANNAYKTISENHMSGMEVCSELYKGILRNLNMAKKAYENNELEQMVVLNNKTIKILIVLQTYLTEEGGETSIWLNNLYNSLFSDISRALRVDDTPAHYDMMIESVAPVSERWEEFAKQTALN
jgi:flagellar biosynthetic protein FliS